MRPEGAARSLVLTLDIITPVVDDPRAFGRIAACNSISDVYAMGGEPEVALSFAGIPDSLGLEVLEAVLAGMAEKALEAGCAIVGGHTIKDSEPKCGLVVVGSVEPGRAWTHRGGRIGQHLVLTKPIGTGVIAQALRARRVEAEVVEAATSVMQALNRRARDLGRNHGVTAATDVTGFGLLGHLFHLVSASGVGARIRVRDVPLLSGALEAAAQGHIPGGSVRNSAYVRSHLRGADSVDPLLLTLLSDAQTSGGLLLTLDAAQSAPLLQALGNDPPCALIGELIDAPPGTIELV